MVPYIFDEMKRVCEDVVAHLGLDRGKVRVEPEQGATDPGIHEYQIRGIAEEDLERHGGIRGLEKKAREYLMREYPAETPVLWAFASYHTPRRIPVLRPNPVRTGVLSISYSDENCTKALRREHPASENARKLTALRDRIVFRKR